ncbi:MAG: ATP-dependent helicase RecG [Patescibacteria group bacterium]|nr:ATP-dependent helicase RecG [Patescibacteria group bacterium]
MLENNLNNENIEKYKKLNPNQKEGLIRLGIKNAYDLLHYITIRYINYGEISQIGNLMDGSFATLYGTLKNVKVKKSWKTKINMTEAHLFDGVKNIDLVWFNQPYIGKIYPENTLVQISGKVENKNNKQYIINPSIDKINNIPEASDSLFREDNDNSDNLIPIYAETKHVTSRFILETIKRIIKSEYFDNLTDVIPEHIRKELHLPSIKDAILYIHFPKNNKLAESAKKRFLFEEMFIIQLLIQEERKLAEQSLSYHVQENNLNEFFDLHEINPTNAQRRVLDDILKDLRADKPMQRLLEGDVGSGKTLVAASAIYNVIKNKKDNKVIGSPLQAAYLAPTEILAMQQFESLINLLAHTGISVGYISGKAAYKFPSKIDPESYTKISKAQLSKWIKSGEISLLVGTHSITKKSVEFKDLALVIIDEQHRFGINTRKDLAHKKGDNRLEIPHLLSMTATPIPRTLALSIFGDLDLSIIDELPKGRKPIKTKFIYEKDRNKTYDFMIDQVGKGKQVFIVCSKINEKEDTEDGQVEKRKSVESELKRIQKYLDQKEATSDTDLNKINIKGLHSKIKTAEQEQIMQDFKDNQIQILIATSLVEVGVNIPNATMMIIEDAERFGYSQLHQLRGRIGRGNDESYCFLFSSSFNEKSLERLKNFSSTNNGFELAEMDMNQRGIGSLLSSNQSGMSDLGMEALKNIKLVELAKKYAKEIIENDPLLENYSELKNRLKELDNIHME